jgi:hypothetical protein
MRRSDYEDEPPEEIHVDEEMDQALDVYFAMSTQWRSGMNGATGLDYSSLPFLMELYKIDDRELVFNDLRVLEAAALKMMHRANK